MIVITCPGSDNSLSSITGILDVGSLSKPGLPQTLHCGLSGFESLRASQLLLKPLLRLCQVGKGLGVTSSCLLSCSIVQSSIVTYHWHVILPFLSWSLSKRQAPEFMAVVDILKDLPCTEHLPNKKLKSL